MLLAFFQFSLEALIRIVEHPIALAIVLLAGITGLGFVGTMLWRHVSECVKRGTSVERELSGLRSDIRNVTTLMTTTHQQQTATHTLASKTAGEVAYIKGRLDSQSPPPE